MRTEIELLEILLKEFESDDYAGLCIAAECSSWGHTTTIREIELLKILIYRHQNNRKYAKQPAYFWKQYSKKPRIRFIKKLIAIYMKEELIQALNKLQISSDNLDIQWNNETITDALYETQITTKNYSIDLEIECRLQLVDNTSYILLDYNISKFDVFDKGQDKVETDLTDDEIKTNIHIQI